MIGILNILGIAPDSAQATNTSGEQNAGQGVFASLLAMLKTDGVPAGGQGVKSQLMTLIDGAKQALAVPDISDGEISDILEGLVADLTALIAPVPEFAAQTVLSAGAGKKTADVAPVQGMPPRIVAEGIDDLRAYLGGMVEKLSGDAGGLSPEPPADGEASVPPLVLKLVQAVRAEIDPTGAARGAGLTKPGVIDFTAAAAQPATQPVAIPTIEAAAAPAPVAVGPMPQTAPVQSIAPAPPPPPQMPVEPQAVMSQIRAHIGQEGRIRVELRPEGLGMMEIDLAPDEAGQLRVVVRAENASVLMALRGDRDGLMTMLREAGHNVDDRNLSFSQFGQDGGQKQTRQANGERTIAFGAQDAPDAEDETGDTDTRPRLMPLGDGVDVRI